MKIRIASHLAFAFTALAACGAPQSRTTSPQTVPSGPATGAPTASAAPAPVAQTPDAPFRAHPPDPQPTRPFTPPHIESFALGNGVHVLLVERHDLPIVVTQFVTKRGGDDAPVNRAGLASLVGTLLETGTTTRNSIELSDAYAALGAEHATWMSWDSGGGFVKVLTANYEPALTILADVIQHPSFAQDEIERARARRLAALQQEADSPRTLASNLAARTVYGETHPYGRSSSGTEAGVRAITRQDIQRFYQTHFVPADGALVVVGDVTRASVTPVLERTFGRWHATAPRQRPVANPPALRPGTRVFVIDRPHAPQSAVSLAQAGVPRSSRDYAAVVVMNTILGGMFSSRINLNLRERHAYTYGAGSSFQFRHGAGPFSIGGAIVTDHTADAVHEILDELARMRNGDVTAEELALAKARVTESLPSRFETTDQTASAVSDLFAYGLPLDEYATITARINAVTAADVRRVAQQYLDPDHARIVVVGDRETVEPALHQLQLGDVEIRDVHGDPVHATTAGSSSSPAAAGGASSSAPPRANPRGNAH
jgi:zinc protease